MIEIIWLTDLITGNIDLMFINVGAQVVRYRDGIQHILGLSNRAGSWIELVVAQK